MQLAFVAVYMESYLTCSRLQFGNMGSLEQHGFARNRLWELDSSPSPTSPNKSQSSVDIILRSTDDDLKMWSRR